METQQAFEDQVNELLSLNEEELLVRLGEDILPPSMGLLQHPREKALKAAKKWMEEKHASLQKTICGSVSLHYYLTDPNKFDKVIVVASVMDLLSNALINVSPVVVAVLVVKEGVKSFCKNYTA